MGNIFFGDYNKAENLSIIIDLPKTCYYPGEVLSGTIILQAKNNKISPVFNFTKAFITLTQNQQYQYYQNFELITQNENKQIYSNLYNFKKYKKISIITPLSIPFSFRIPEKIVPTFIYKETNFIKHFLTITFPQIKSKKTIGIIIQNRQIFLNKNDPFKSPIEKFNDVQKSFFFKKYSKIAYLFKTESNSYGFNEMIPYDIIMNCTECDLIINKLRVSLTRNIYFCLDDKIDLDIILFKDYEFRLINKKGIVKISDHFQFPEINEYFSVNPMNIYNNFDKKKLYDSDKDFRDVSLFPTCFSSLFICNYSLNFEIIFNSFFIKNEILSIPIELYTPLNFKKNDRDDNSVNINTDENKETFSDEETSYNKVNCINITNDENESNSNLNYENEFEIIEKEDFYKVLSNEN